MNWSYESVRNINESGILYQFPVYFNHNFPFLTKPRKSLIIKGVYFSLHGLPDYYVHITQREWRGGGRETMSLSASSDKKKLAFLFN